MPRTRWRYSTEELWALSREGVLTHKELVRTGASTALIAYRCGRDGPWQRLLPGVVLLTNGRPTPRQRLLAALAYAGDGALITGAPACLLRRMRSVPADAAIHLLIPHERRRQSVRQVVVERTTRLPPARTVDGLPLAPVARSALDAARRMGNVDDVRALLAEAVQRRLCTVPELTEELEAGSDRGSALPRLVLAEVGSGVRSVAEAWARRLARRSGLPFLWNVDLRDAAGRWLGRPDGWLDDVGLAWEIDSYAFHLGPQPYARSLDRDNRLAAAGIIVVRTLPTRLLREPDTVLDELRRSYAQARRRPRPNVTMINAAAA